MTGLLHLDTHVVVWLAAGEHDRFPGTLRARLTADTLRISPMVRLELSLLRQRSKIDASAEVVLERVAEATGLAEDETAFRQVIKAATNPVREWPNRDPFDRIIMSTALAAGVPLATKDTLLRTHFPDDTLWD